MKKTVAILFTLLLCLLFACAALAVDALPTATVATKSSPLTMRNMPNADGKPLGDIPKGETVTVLGGGSFPLVEYDGQRGYVNGQYLQMNAEPDAAASEWIDTGVFVRTYPSSVRESQIIAIKKRAAAFEKTTRTQFVLLYFEDPNDNQQAAYEELNALMTEYHAKQGDYDGILGVFFNTARNTKFFMAAGRAANEMLDAADADARCEKIEAAYDEKLPEGYDKACIAYMDALEEYLK